MQHSADSGGTDGPDGRDDRAREREREQASHDADQVYGITTAETSHTQEITRRQKQYILTMLVRVVSIIVVVAVPGISWPIKIGLCVVATIIPYVAVVRANGGPMQEKDPTNLMLGRPGRPELGAAQRGLPGPGDGDGQDFIVGEWVHREPSESADAASAEDAARTTEDDGRSGRAGDVSDPVSGCGAAADAAFDQQSPDARFIRIHKAG